MNEKIHFDIYKSRSLSLRIELSEIQRKLGELEQLQERAKLCEAKLGYYNIQMVRFSDMGYKANEPINKIEKVAS